MLPTRHGIWTESLPLKHYFYRHFGVSDFELDTEYDWAKVPPYNGNDPPPAPCRLQALLFPSLLNKAVKLKTGPRFGGFNVKNWSKFKVKNWSKFFFHCFFPNFIVFFGHF